jgi:hypothetical protein
MSTITQKLRRSATLVLVLMMLVSLIGAVGASAAVKSAVTVTEIGYDSSDGVGSTWKYENDKIVGSTQFHAVGDTVTLRVTVKNNDGVPYKVTSVKDDFGENDYLEFDYSKMVGKTLNTSGTTDLYFTVTYKNGVGNADGETAYGDIIKTVETEGETEKKIVDLRQQYFKDNSLTLTLNYEAPATADGSNGGVWFALLAVSALGLAVLALTGKNGKKAMRFMGLLLAFMLVIPVSANATTVKVKIDFDGEFDLLDKLLVCYNPMATDNDEYTYKVVDYNKNFTVETTSATKKGYTFKEWNTVQYPTVQTPGTGYGAGRDAKIIDEMTLYGQWTANTYTVSFNANGGTGSMTDESFTYDVEKALTTNTLTPATGYEFDGWNTVQTPTTGNPGTAYTDGASVSNLTAVNNGNVTLYAQWKVVDYKNNITYTSANVQSNDNQNKVSITNGTVIQDSKTAGWGASGTIYVTAGESEPAVAWGKVSVVEAKIQVTSQSSGTLKLKVDSNVSCATTGNDDYGTKYVVLDGEKVYTDLTNGFDFPCDGNAHTVQLFMVNDDGSDNPSHKDMKNANSTFGFDLTNASSSVTYTVSDVKVGVAPIA